jgi:hypothetical protein
MKVKELMKLLNEIEDTELPVVIHLNDGTKDYEMTFEDSYYEDELVDVELYLSPIEIDE